MPNVGGIAEVGQSDRVMASDLDRSLGQSGPTVESIGMGERVPRIPLLSGDGAPDEASASPSVAPSAEARSKRGGGSSGADSSAAETKRIKMEPRSRSPSPDESGKVAR